jgi:hypothetical protein
MLMNDFLSSKKWIDLLVNWKDIGICNLTLITLNGCPIGQRRNQARSVELSEAYLPDLLNIGQSQKYLSDSVLHEGGHSVSDALVSQYVHWSLALNE